MNPKLILLMTFWIFQSVVRAQDSTVKIQGKIEIGEFDTVVVTFFADSLELHSMLIYSDTFYSFETPKKHLRMPFRTEYLKPASFRFLDSVNCLEVFPFSYWSPGFYDWFDTIDDRSIYCIRDIKIGWWFSCGSFSWSFKDNSNELAECKLEELEAGLGCFTRMLVARHSGSTITLRCYSGANDRNKEKLAFKRANLLKDILISNGFNERAIRTEYLGHSKSSAGAGYISLMIKEN